MIPRQKLVDPSTHVRDARLYIVVVEGDTEYNYFDALRAQDFIPKHRVRIEPAKPTENKSASNHLIACAEEKFNSITNRFTDDECWLVFDVESLSRNDKREQQVRETIDVARDQEWFVALSNPSFEVWYVLHVTDDLTGIDGTGNSAKKTLGRLLGGYRESNVPATCLDRQAIQLAIRRAKTRDTDPNSPIPELPSTRVYRLVERLIGARVA